MNPKLLLGLALVLSGGLLGCSTTSQRLDDVELSIPPAAELLDVSLVQLIANSKDYDGKFVRVIGFVSLEFEGNGIYLHEEDYKHGISKNGLWIDATVDISKRKVEFDKKYVLLEGTFNAKETGHMGLWSGSIQQIKRFQVWTKP
jgi:hypothetical protein